MIENDKVEEKTSAKKQKKDKRPFPKLAFKIMLGLFLTILIVNIIFTIATLIAQSAGWMRPDDASDFDNWIRILLAIFAIATMIGIMTIFIFIINRVVVKRVRKLEEVAGEIAKGKLGLTIDVKGSDELSRLAMAFNAMSKELEANEYLSKEFVRNVSHEFKTPLSIIKGYGELIEGEGGKKKASSEALIEYGRAIMEQSDRLATLSKSILQLSLIDSTTLIKKDDNFAPKAQVEEILRLMQPKWLEKKIVFDLVLDDISITSNEQLLYQVWQNLIANAVKFSNNGGTIKIAVSRQGDSGLNFEITDSGIGINEADKDKIFDHFYMADKSRNTEGSGLGLAIVKKILSKLGGSITFESEEGQGTKFSVIL